MIFLLVINKTMHLPGTQSMRVSSSLSVGHANVNAVASNLILIISQVFQQHVVQACSPHSVVHCYVDLKVRVICFLL